MPFSNSQRVAPDFADNVVRRLDDPTIGGKPLGAQPTLGGAGADTLRRVRGWRRHDGVLHRQPGACIELTPCRPHGVGPQPARPVHRRRAITPGWRSPTASWWSRSTSQPARRSGNPDGITPAEVDAARSTSPATAPSVVSDLSTQLAARPSAPAMPRRRHRRRCRRGRSARRRRRGCRPRRRSRPPARSTSKAASAACSSATSYGERIDHRRRSIRRRGALGTPRAVQLEAGALGVTVVRVSPRSRGRQVPLRRRARRLGARRRSRSRGRVRDQPRSALAAAASICSRRRLDPLPPTACRRAGSAAFRSAIRRRRGARRWPPRPASRWPGAAADATSPSCTSTCRGNRRPSIAPPAAGPATLVGDFAWIISSDGRGTVVNIFDACPPPNQQYRASANGGPYTRVVRPRQRPDVRTSRHARQPGHPEAMLLDRAVAPAAHRPSALRHAADPSDTSGQPRVTDELNPCAVAVPPTSSVAPTAAWAAPAPAPTRRRRCRA